MTTHHRPGGGFQNPWNDRPDPGFRDFLKWVLVERPRHGRPPDPPRNTFARATPNFPAPRAPADRAVLTCGWAALARGRRVLFGGDSAYPPAFAEIGKRCGPFDAALLPIGAYEPRWFMRFAHMNPEEAVQALVDLDPAGRTVMVPMHWGTFKLTDEPMDEPPARVARAWQSAGRPADRLWRLAHGETRAL